MWYLIVSIPDLCTLTFFSRRHFQVHYFVAGEELRKVNSSKKDFKILERVQNSLSSEFRTNKGAITQGTIYTNSKRKLPPQIFKI